MIDVIEMDAASHTSIENIKEIIEHAQFTPTQGKYKVYIIDEIHMLSTKAFNALLKTLEEPPAHVIFLLATTQINAVPETILSRVIRFDLNKIGEVDMLKLLKKICTQEGLTYEEEALKMIVHRARGSIRDSLTMLEKCILEKTVTEKNVEDALHLVTMGFLRETFEACVSGDGEAIQHVLTTINSEGIDVRQFSAQMTEWIVDNIEEAFRKNMFAAYKDVFDLFTRVYVQGKQVSVPMDILRMNLFERVTHGTIAPPKQTRKEPPQPPSAPAPIDDQPPTEQGNDETEPPMLQDTIQAEETPILAPVDEAIEREPAERE